MPHDADLRPKPRITDAPPVTLRQVGTDLTHRAIDGRLGAAFGRDALVQQLLKQLGRPGAAILLVGPSGVGKTAIVHEIVRRLAALGKPLHERTDVWAVDGNRIIAGMSVVGRAGLHRPQPQQRHQRGRIPGPPRCRWPRSSSASRWTAPPW